MTKEELRDSFKVNEFIAYLFLGKKIFKNRDVYIGDSHEKNGEKINSDPDLMSKDGKIGIEVTSAEPDDVYDKVWSIREHYTRLVKPILKGVRNNKVRFALFNVGMTFKNKIKLYFKQPKTVIDVTEHSEQFYKQTEFVMNKKMQCLNGNPESTKPGYTPEEMHLVVMSNLSNKDEYLDIERLVNICKNSSENHKKNYKTINFIFTDKVLTIIPKQNYSVEILDKFKENKSLRYEYQI